MLKNKIYRMILASATLVAVLGLTSGSAYAASDDSFLDRVKENAPAAGSYLKDKGSDLLNWGKEKGSQAIDWGQEKLPPLLDKAKEQAPVVIDHAQEKLNDARQGISDYRERSEDEFFDWFNQQTNQTPSDQPAASSEQSDQSEASAGQNDQSALLDASGNPVPAQTLDSETTSETVAVQNEATKSAEAANRPELIASADSSDSSETETEPTTAEPLVDPFAKLDAIVESERESRVAAESEAARRESEAEEKVSQGFQSAPNGQNSQSPGGISPAIGVVVLVIVAAIGLVIALKTTKSED